jgi:tRNA (cmo5U34)-methyltransferase
MQKSTPEQIRQRFDNDVERFSDLHTGQAATIDSPLCMDLIAQSAATFCPRATDILDLGCGAGNYTLKLLEKLSPPDTTPTVHCTLVDLSKPMLDRALQRIRPHTAGRLTPLQGDMRNLNLGQNAFDIVVSASTFHHLRTDAEWTAMFQKVFHALRPGGCFFIFDLIEHSHPALQSLMRTRYADYLQQLQGGGPAGVAYREKVFAYVEEEDTPRPLMYQLDLLKQTGFADPDILHKNNLFAAFGARR